MSELMKQDKQYVMNTYARFGVAFSSGKGATLTDENGKAYIDLGSGIGVNSIGYADPDWVSAVGAQAGKLAHVSNLYYTQPCVEVAEKLVQTSNGLFSKVFFGNSGAEANEGMIKVARKYSYDKYGKGRSKIITLNESFHGRTITTLAATGQGHFHDYFFPFTEGFTYVEPGDFESIVQNADGACAVMMEAVQGEGGVIPLEKAFVEETAAFAKDKDLLLLFDEVQTGIGRTGKLFGFQHFDVQPDVISIAKGLGGGLPIGAVLCNEKTAGVLGFGDHGTTFGGNPVSCAGAKVVLDKLTANGFLDAVAQKGGEIMQALTGMDTSKVAEVRGKGMMIAIQLKDGFAAKDAAVELLEKGVVILTAGRNSLRLLPPLTISDAELEQALGVIREVLA
jgi:acetylornithine/N-succinyldiaminopimelate aminotransferase